MLLSVNKFVCKPYRERKFTQNITVQSILEKFSDVVQHYQVANNRPKEGNHLEGNLYDHQCDSLTVTHFSNIVVENEVTIFKYIYFKFKQFMGIFFLNENFTIVPGTALIDVEVLKKPL